MPQDHGDGRSVVSMAGFVNAARFNAVHEVEAYWEAIRAGRLVPRRSDIDPRGIERALEYAFILERVAPGIARLRIAGSHLSDLMGMEVRGMPLSAFMTPQGRNTLGEVLEEVFENPSKALLELHSEGGIGKPEIDARLLLLPMKNDLGDITRVLGCLATSGEIGRAPRRFDITTSQVTALLGDFMKHEPEEEDPSPVPRGPAAPGIGQAPFERRDGLSGIRPDAATRARGLSEPPAPFEHAPGPARTVGFDGKTTRRPRLRPGPRPYLSVVEDGDDGGKDET